MNMSALWKLSYGMYALTAMDDNRPTGCIINTAVQVTSQNPTIAISLNRNNYTYDVIKKSGKFALSIISEETSQNVIARLGFCSGRDTDKFAEAEFAWAMRDGLPIITDKASAYITAEVLGSYEMETHFVILARVLAADVLSEAQPMTYKYYHEKLKGKASKKAPTYIEEKEEKTKGNRYKCTICGYIYDDDKEKVKFADLPDDWKCPLCGVGKDKFIKI